MSNLESPAAGGVVLGEGAILERLRRHAGVVLDPEIANAGLLYEIETTAAMRRIVAEYLGIAEEYGLPFLVTTPTWRAQADRVASSRFCERPVQRDGVAFAREIASEARVLVQVAGLIGPKGDCYRPEESPSAAVAKEYHRPQVLELAEAGVDWILAATLPGLNEARGIVQLRQEAGTRIVPSFVLDPEGRLLDGHSLSEAAGEFEEGVLLNCTHWSFARRALEEMGDAKIGRVLGLQANAAACNPRELEGSAELQSEGAAVFAEGMRALSRDFGLRILGGCCGTGPEHIRALAGRLTGP